MKETKPINLIQALLPLGLLIAMLALNISMFGSDTLGGANQCALLTCAALALAIGIYNKVSYDTVLGKVSKNIKTTSEALLVLLMVGALSGTWLMGGVIPSMVYYGLQILNPKIFLVSTLLICVIISLACGSSWTTTATAGIALIGIGRAMGIPDGMTAGAIVSGAYFGDKISPLSDTTVLASAVSKTDLFTHIRYMMYTTIPSILLAIVLFTIMGLFLEVDSNTQNIETLLKDIKGTFHVTIWTFLIPIAVIFMILKKVKALVALFIGTLLGAVSAIVFQSDVLASTIGLERLSVENTYKSIIGVIGSGASIKTENPALNELFSSGGMKGMLNTVWLIICAMVFGGVMEAIGALALITKILLRVFHTIFGLFASTVASCLVLNVTASEQYLSIVLTGKMFSKAYKSRGLAPENLSRSLEDSATVTSVLVPWNTCGAYQSTTLGVGTLTYLPYAFFNIASPFMTLLFAALSIKIRKLTGINAALVKLH